MRARFVIILVIIGGLVETKFKGFVFVEKNENFNIYNFEFIGAKNNYELASYLNSDKHKINGNFTKRNIDMKLTLQKNFKDQYFLPFSQ